MKTSNFGLSATVAAIACLTVGRADAAYLIEVDTDGLDDGVLTYNSHFGFAGDTTAASQSETSTALGMSGGDSIFGGDGATGLDTYRYTYTPGPDADNLDLAAGDDLGNGNVATGVAGGLSGMYKVYATWPFTFNVSGGPTSYLLSDGGATLFDVQIDQNNQGNNWILLGTADLMAGTTYTLTQIAGVNTFVSMRAAGVLFEMLPMREVAEPGTLALLGLGIAGFALRRRLKSD